MSNKYQSLHSNQKILIYEMLKRGISVEIIDASLELIKASYKGHDELLYDRDSSIMPYQLSVLAGDKGITKKLLQENGLSVPLGEVFSSNDTSFIIEAFHILNCPVVLKPVFGSHGYDVYTNLEKDTEVEEALDNIRRHRGKNTKVLIEEHYDGEEYRVFVTKNRDYAVLHRDPAHVFGDGTSTIEELINKENNRRMNPRTNALCEILVDEEVHKYLQKQKRSINDIPNYQEKVYVRANSNVAMGGICEDYTEKTNQSVIDIGMKVLDTFPGIPYVGIDYMTNSITKQQTNDSYRIIEINTVPGIHMHFRPAIGESRNIAKYMVDMIYPETKEEENSYVKTYQKSFKRL